MIEAIRRTLEQVLPVRRGEVELALAERPEIGPDGLPIATLRCTMFDAEGTRSQTFEQSVVLLAAHPDTETRGIAAIEGFGRALPELVARHPAVRLGSDGAIFPEELLCSELLARTNATTPEEFAAFLLGAQSPFEWARRATLDPAYRPLVVVGDMDWQAALHGYL